MKELANRLANEESEESKAIAGRYMERLSLADIAEKISKVAALKVMDSAALTKIIQALQPVVQTWPTAIQVALVERACCDAVVSPTSLSVVDALLRIVSLWGYPDPKVNVRPSRPFS